MNLVDPDGKKIRIKDQASLDAIYNGLSNKNIQIVMDENGVVDPSSLEKDSEDFFMRDLYEIASNMEYMVELSVADKYSFRTQDGRLIPVEVSKTAPYDDDDNIIATSNDLVILDGEPFGRHIQGNTGRSLFPVPSKQQSPDGNIHVIINEKGTLNHRTVGVAHEFGHVLLFLRNLPYRHGDNGVDSFISSRASEMSKRLGYDY